MTYFHSQQLQRPSTSCFSSSASPTMQFRRSPSVQQQIRGQSYSVAKKQKESEAQVQSSERMTSLHSRLQQEAEKIRKWKNAIELDTKHKEKCLEEANSTIEKQQKVITELQLKNEALQVQVEEEITNQKEIKTKISTTREMCTALKNHCVKIDAVLAQGQEDKEKLFRMNQERVAEYEMLQKKYEELEKEQVQWHQTYQDTLSAEQKDKEEQAQRYAELSEEMKSTLSQVKMLEEQLAEEKSSIAALTERLAISQEEEKHLHQNQEHLQVLLSTKDEQINDLNDRIIVRDEEIKSSRIEADRVAEELTEVKTNLRKEMESRQEEVNGLEDSLKKTVLEWTLKCENLNSELAGTLKSLEETATSKEMVATQLVESKNNCKSMKEELDLVKKTCKALEAAKKQALVELEEIKEQLAVSRKEAECQREDKERGLERAEKLISEVASRHDSARANWQEREVQLESKLTDAEQERDRMAGDLLALKQELQETEKKLEESVTLAKDTDFQHEACVRLLTSEVEGLRSECETLKLQIQELAKNEKTLALQCSDKADVIRKNGELAALLESKTDQLRIMENKLVQENELNLSSTCQLVQEKETALKECEVSKSEVQALASQLAASKCNQDMEKQKHASELRIVQEDLSCKIASLKDEMEKLKREAEMAKKEHVRLQKECDKEVQDLVAAMDSYRSEHEKTVAGKERIIESLRIQLQHNEQYKDSSEREFKIYEGQLKQLRVAVEEKNCEIKQLVASVEELKMKVEASEKEIDKKKVEVKELRNSMEISSQKAEESISSDVVSTTPSKNAVKSTPRIHALKQKPSTTVPEIQSAAEPSSSQRGLVLKPSVASSNTPLQHPTHIFKTPALPTPGRLYSYRVKATPHQKAKSLHITPRSVYSNRGKRMRCQMNTDSTIDGEKENTAVRVADEEEIVLKKQRTKKARATVHQVSSTTTTKTGKRGPAKKQSKEDLSWFELDSVYGFGSND